MRQKEKVRKGRGRENIGGEQVGGRLRKSFSYIASRESSSFSCLCYYGRKAKDRDRYLKENGKSCARKINIIKGIKWKEQMNS